MDDTTPVLLVHGFGSSFRHGWVEPGWVDLLADAGRPVIGVELPGHGDAPAPGDDVGPEHLDAVVEAALPEGRPVDAVGFSLGAQVLLRVAAARPAAFRRLALIGIGANLFREDDPGPIVAALRSGTAGEDVGARVFLDLVRSAGNDARALAGVLLHARRPFTPADLAAVRVPTLVVIGEHDFAGPAEPLVAALPDARLRVLRGLDHFQAPRDVGCIAAVLDFIGA